MTSRFSTTRWSVIRHAAMPEQRRRAALEEIYRAYWKPICRYLGLLGVPADEAEDAAQDFFLQFFDSPALRTADPAQGRFRAYLIGALKRHVQKRHRHATAQKRGGGLAVMPLLDTDLPEATDREDEVARSFDQEWAHALFGLSLQRLDREITASGHTYPAVPGPEEVVRLLLGGSEESQDTAAQRLGLTTTALKTRLFRWRRRLGEILREEVSRTLSDDGELEAELAYLSGLVGASWSQPSRS
ncbi:MAG: RNA polymerase sigma factor [Verrucomicrobium sp.]|nr:sigma-70 family RNA polymerase sigma factor [Verrucomicrobium sp.]